MFKSIVLAIACLIPLVIQPSQAVTSHPNLILTDANIAQTPKPIEQQYRDSMGRKRSPESLERQRNRNRSAYQKQLNFRRKYGDLAPLKRQQYRDYMGRKRSPESLERQRNRKLSAYQKQLNFRRKHGDLAPSRQSR